ncbi:MAG TPA: KH domain-containing protein [Caldilineae bacterium]|nr:KH domain-containing protein [Caldilineae bacterium]
MKELVAYMAKNLVNDPSQVRVVEKEGPRSITLELSVAPDDMGRVIGKGGRVANAMRTLLRVAAMRQGKRVTLNIVEPEDA